jgi:osmotically-inducible protein OsmY
MTTAIKKTDWDLRDDVSRELAWDQRVDAKHVAVQVSEGVVMLAGTVDSWLARNAAVEAAHRVAGVRDVADELEVRPTDGTLTDPELAHAARQALEKDALAPAQLVQITVADGSITLRGTVQTMTARAEAERAVERLRGIRRVVNEIEIHPGLDPSGVKEAIESALARQSVRETKHLQISLTDGRVVVEGVVRSTAERRAVLGAVHGTRGVAGVDDRLVVEP